MKDKLIDVVNENGMKKVWTTPTIEQLPIYNTEYWEYHYNERTGFWQISFDYIS